MVPPIALAALAGVPIIALVALIVRRRRRRAARAAAALDASIARLAAERAAAEVARHRRQVIDALAEALGDVETERAIVRLTREALLALDADRPYELHLVDRFDPELVLRFTTGAIDPDAPEHAAPWDSLAGSLGETIVYPTTDVDGLCPHLAARLVEHCSAVCVPLVPRERFAGVLYAMGPEHMTPPVELIETYETIAELAGTALALVRAFGTTRQTRALPPPGDPPIMRRPAPGTTSVGHAATADAPLHPVVDTVIVDVREPDRPHRPEPTPRVTHSIDPNLAAITGLDGLATAKRAIDDLAARRVPYALIGFEIDHFDSYHGWHGEPGYHQALRLLTRIAEADLHHDALLCAVAPGCFLAVLPRVSARRALGLAGRIREDLAHACRSGAAPAFTVCFGIVQGGAGTSTEDVLGALDDALTDAQARGVDRAVVNVGVANRPAGDRRRAVR